MIVVDASLAVKWLFREADTPEAFDFLQRHRGALVAPELIFIEVAGVIVRRANEIQSYRDDALDTARLWERTYSEQGIKGFRLTPRRLATASTMALTIRHPLKDCFYVALARELNCELATCDVKLRDKASSFYPNIRLLADYSAPLSSA